MNMLLERDALTFDLGRGGFLEIFKGPGARASAEAFATLLERMGASVKRLDRQACVTLEPSLLPIESSIEVELWPENDCWGDAHQFTREIARVAAKEGVRFGYNTEALALTSQRDR